MRDYLDALHKKDSLGDDTFGLIWRAIRGRSQTFDQLMSSRSNGAAESLPSLHYEQIISALRIFSEAAKQFEANYGPLGKSAWYTSDSLAGAETVEKLADHVQQFDQFWQNDEYIDLFGPHWKGPETLFEEIRFGVKYREFLRIHLLSLPQGEVVGQRFTSMDASSILSLGKYAKAGHLFRDLPARIHSVFGPQSIAVFETEISGRLNFAKIVAGIDPSHGLADFIASAFEANIPPGQMPQLFEAHFARQRVDQIRRQTPVLQKSSGGIIEAFRTAFADRDRAKQKDETRKLVHRLNALRLRPLAQDTDYDLRSTYEVKSDSPSFETVQAEADEAELSATLPAFDLFSEAGPLSEEEAVSALEVFRDSVIAREIENWERQRSILRDSMIEALIKQRVSDPREWIIKVPHYQRSGTNQIEKNRYLVKICQIVGRISADTPIELGETEETEFKSTLRVNLVTRQKDPKMEFTAIRAIASLLNSSGGKLIIGVSDDGKAVGLEIDGFDSEDRMSMHLNNLIHDRIGSHHSAHLRVRFEDYDGARIMVVACTPARLPVFLKDSGSEKFFIRNGTTTRELSGNQQLEYIRSRFES